MPDDSTRVTKELLNAVASALSLIATFKTSQVTDVDTLPANAPDPLSVARDAAKLIKAHITKISLLIINEPFTPSAIRKIIADDLAGTCLPALMSAVEIIRPGNYGCLMQRELKSRVNKVMCEIESLLLEVSNVASGEQSDGGSKGRDSLISTGVVWEACDALIELKDGGIAILAVKRTNEYREMLEDAIQELKEWAEDVDDNEDNEGIGYEDEMENHKDVDEYGANLEEDDMVRMLGAANRLPASRSDLKDTLQETLRKLKLIATLYQALVKRRLKGLGSQINLDEEGKLRSEAVKQLDELMDLLKQISDDADDVAGAFYELDNDEARDGLTQIVAKASRVAELQSINWAGKNDAFTAWSAKWLEAINTVQNGE